MNDVTTNPFNVARATGDTAAAAVAAQAKALVEARYVVALRRPRDMDAVRQRILRECLRPSFAAVARYIKPIGQDPKKWPSGPSVRFAEAAIRAMGNITVDAVTTHDDAERRIVHVTVTDLESNVPYSLDVPIVKTIERRRTKDGDQVLGERTNSKGEPVYIIAATDDDIQNKASAMVSKAIRTLALRLVPGDLIDEAMDQIVITQRNQDAADPDDARRKLFDAFGSLGITPDQLKAYLGGDTPLTPKGLADLRALYASLRDGEATWRDIVDAREKAGDGDGSDPPPGTRAPPTAARDVIARRRAARKAANEAAPPPPASDEPAGGGPPAWTLEEYAAAILRAPDSDAAVQILDEARSVLTEEELAQLGASYSAKWQGG
jgi:hypothetical protein